MKNYFYKPLQRYLFVLFYLLVANSFAQETFFRTYEFDPACGSQSFSIAQAEDGGFYIGGIYACQMFMNDWMFFKTDSHGEVQWLTRFSSTMSPMLRDMIVGGNGNVYGVGQVYKYEEGQYFPGIGAVTPSGDSLTWDTNCIAWDEACGYARGITTVCQKQRMITFCLLVMKKVVIAESVMCCRRLQKMEKRYGLLKIQFVRLVHIMGGMLLKCQMKVII